MKKPVLLLLLGGCATSWPAPSAPPSELAAFLEPGTTRWPDVLCRWGAPTLMETRERVLAYRLAVDGFGELRPVRGGGRFGWIGVQYHVVLAFDEEHVLEEIVVYTLREESPW